MNPKYKNDPYKFVGTTLGGFRVEEFIQSGGMGAVYRARSVHANIIVAIKILKPDVAIKNPETAGMLFKEAEQTAALNHPNIIRVTYADLTDEGCAYIVMEWLDGHSLEQELSKHGRMEPERVATLLEQVCGAVSYAHRRGLVHRDLKPNNIMLIRNHASEEQVKVLDFGIAKAIDATFGFNSRIIGAPHYASPEQLAEHTTIDHRADIYSLGITAYELLTGERPFDANSWEMVIQQQLIGTPKPLSQIQPGMPEAVEAVILRALAKRPGERFQDAQQFARAFRNAVNLGGATLNLRCLDAEANAPLEGASVYLNGRYEGRTDKWGAWGRSGLLPREWQLEVECHRYERLSRSVRCMAAENTEVEVGLTLKPVGELLVRARAANATVTLNGAKVGTIDKSGSFYLAGVAPGMVRVQLSHPKFHAAAMELEIAQGQEHHLEVEMRPRSIFSPARWLSRTPRPAKPRPAKPSGARPRWKRTRRLCAAMLLLIAVAAGGWQTFRYFTTGQLIIRGAPPGTQVALDGAAARWRIDASGDLIIEGLKRGTHLVELNAEGFIGEQKQVELQARERIVPFTLLRDAKLRVTRGNQLFAENDFAGAEAKYREAVDIEPNDPEIHKLLAAALFKLNLPDKAEEEYLRACELSPDKPACYYNSGVMWLRENEPERALTALIEAVNFSAYDDPKSASYLAERSAAHLALNQTNEALNDATLAVKRDYQNARCHSVLGDVYSARSEYNNALTAYREAVKLAPKNDDYHFKLAEALYNKAKKTSVPEDEMLSALDEAKTFYQDAILLTDNADKKKKYVGGVRKTDIAIKEAREPQDVEEDFTADSNE